MNEPHVPAAWFQLESDVGLNQNSIVAFGYLVAKMSGIVRPVLLSLNTLFCLLVVAGIGVLTLTLADSTLLSSYIALTAYST